MHDSKIENFILHTDIFSRYSVTIIYHIVFTLMAQQQQNENTDRCK